MKNCVICKTPLKGRQTKYCKRGCEATVWRKANIETNKVYTKIAVERNKQKRKEYIAELKKSGCTDCGNSYPPCVMDFDHVRGKKIRNISIAANYGWKSMLEELAKCELVCANCHRVRTQNRKQFSSG
jgi:hypothetical protein